MSGIFIPGGAGAWVRPIPGGVVRPFPGSGVGTGTRPMPGGTIDVGPVVLPDTKPADGISQSQSQGDAIARPKEMAEELTEENNNKRKKDCRCEASYTCKGSVSMQNRGEAGLEYQLHIANLRSVPIVFTAAPLSPQLQGPAKGGKVQKRFNVTEWKFGGVRDWDGFWLSSCTLAEAKGNYGFMFKITGRFEKQIKEWIRDKGQASKHHAVVSRYQKPVKGGKAVKAQWHFQNKKEYEQFNRMAAAQISIYRQGGLSFHHTPYETDKERKKREAKEQKEAEIFCKDNPNICV